MLWVSPGKITALERARGGHFAKKALFNNPERRVFRILVETLASSQERLHAIGQVSLHEFLETDSKFKKGGSFYAISDRRVDFAVVDMTGDVKFAVEYHGSGHKLGNWRERDEIKLIALEKSGIPLLVIEAGDQPNRVREKIRQFAGISVTGVDPDDKKTT